MKDYVGLSEQGRCKVEAIFSKLLKGFELDYYEAGLLAVFLFPYRGVSRQKLIDTYSFSQEMVDLVEIGFSYLNTMSGGVCK